MAAFQSASSILVPSLFTDYVLHCEMIEWIYWIEYKNDSDHFSVQLLVEGANVASRYF